MNVVDFHSHILPYADHGSSSVDVSLAQLSLAAEHGVRRIVLTPHYYPHRENPESFIARREKCYNKLLENLNDESPDVRLGAEVLICDNIEEMPHLEDLCIRGTRILLLELPFTDFSETYVDSVKYLIADGYDVVLAHADRYDPLNIDRLVSLGAKIQLNADSLSSLFVKKHIKRWIDNAYVYAIGSDIHGKDEKAYKRFEKALSRITASPNVEAFADHVWSTSTR